MHKFHTLDGCGISETFMGGNKKDKYVMLINMEEQKWDNLEPKMGGVYKSGGISESSL